MIFAFLFAQSQERRSVRESMHIVCWLEITANVWHNKMVHSAYQEGYVNTSAIKGDQNES